MEAKREGKAGQDGRRQLQGLPLMRTDVAGMDIGSERHWVGAVDEATIKAYIESQKWD